MNWEVYNPEGATGRYLYKFLSEEYLLRFLKSGEIWFARSDIFGDKMECIMINDLASGMPNFDRIEERKRKHLISCFHIGHYETLAFWDTYSKKEDERRKYALRFNTNTLIKSLGDATQLKDNLPRGTVCLNKLESGSPLSH